MKNILLKILFNISNYAIVSNMCFLGSNLHIKIYIIKKVATFFVLFDAVNH